jgi:two-component system response regulator FlrC
MLEPSHLGLGLVAQATAGAPAPSPDGKLHTLSDIEKFHILAAVKQCQGNRTHAARLLNISIRTLRNKLNEYKTGGDAVAEEESARV